MATDEDTKLKDQDDTETVATEGADAAERLNLDVQIESPSACERHITVTIPREDIERYYDGAYSEMMPTAAVPGFRPGRAPRKYVEKRFHKEATEQIKGSLLMDSLEQINEEQKLTAISEPDFDLEAVEVPDDGPMTFEFDIEVRPEFDLPEWKGMKVEKPTKEITDEAVDEQLKSILSRYGALTPVDGAASEGDFLTVDLTAEADGRTLTVKREQSVRLLPALSFQDGRIDDFGKLMKGVKAGDVKETEMTVTEHARNEALRGKTVKLKFEVLDVKRITLPELNSEFLDELGGFESEEALRNAVRQDLERQVEYHQQQRARDQITAALTQSADWELPPSLLQRQAERELERAVLELRRNGFSESQIRARANDLRQNSKESTAKALKEHFILERIAEEEGLEAEPADYDAEMMLIAAQSGESVRRVRAQMEKRGLMDALRNQIIERKAIAKVMDQATFKEVPLKEEKRVETEGLDLAVSGEPPARAETAAESEADEEPAS